jgi:acetolactate synthase-1/2/3 large subunit
MLGTGGNVFTVGMYLVRLLEAYGIEVVFGIPGVHTVELYRGLEQTTLRHVTPRHEQGAGFMADGYARATGRPAACFIITGPGMTNIATAMAQAYSDSVPMLVVSAVNAFGDLGSGEGWLHELKDQRQLVQGVCEFSHTITCPTELNTVIARAFSVFSSARPRPVHIELPLNIITASAQSLPAVKAVALPQRAEASSDQIAQAQQWINASQSPVILLGGGAKDALSASLLAEITDAPAIMTVNGRGLLPAKHPLSVPCSPDVASVRELIETSDLVIAIGTELGPTEYDVFGTGMAKFNRRSIRIDIDSQQLMRSRFADLPIVSDAGKAISKLLQGLQQRNCSGAERAAKARAHVHDGLGEGYRTMRGMLETVRDTLPGVVIVGDSTQPVYAGCVDYAAEAPRTWFCSATGFGTLGYGMPAAIGAKIGVEDRPVVCVTGDGGFQFSLQELACARESGAPVIVVLWNNRGHGEIKSYMLEKGIKPIGVDLFTPDFQLMAKAFACEAVKLKDASDLPAQLKAAAARLRPTIIEIDESIYLPNIA